MDTGSQTLDSFAIGAAPAARPVSDSVRGPSLSLVSTRFRLGSPPDAAPESWHDGLVRVLAWLGIDADFVSASPPRRLTRMTDWAVTGPAAAPAAPVFAPWLGWSPTAFQHGGLPGLPPAQYVASYLIDHPRGAGSAAAMGAAGPDMMLISPHPAACIAEGAGDLPIPRAAVIRAMVAAARSEGRDRIAMIGHARQRNALARLLLATGKGLRRDGLALDILTIEDALPVLLESGARWDAIIAMPDVRSTVFTLLSHKAGIAGAWPLLWFSSKGTLRLVTSEAPGEWQSRLSLDASVLVHALALTLHEAGIGRAAWRLHEAWAQVRDSGITTAGRGHDGPYAKVLDDNAFITLLSSCSTVSKRPPRPWRALKNAEVAKSGAHSPRLNVVSLNP